MKTTVYVKINPRDPDLARLREIARGSREGKVVAFPTETVYGIGIPMSIAGAHETLVKIKNREPSKPFSLHIGEFEMVDYLQVVRTPAFRYLTRKFWPGPLTLLVRDSQGEKMGLRFPANRLAIALINSVGEPLIATSANVSGDPSPKNADDVKKKLDGQIDYLIDGGPCELSQDSTIVDLTEDRQPVIVREGAGLAEITQAVEEIKRGAFPRKNILVVCTGNSCRSPMAEGWLRDELKRARLEQQIEVSSCGIGTRPGSSATYEAVYVMKNREIDISAHRSQLCTREMVVNADLILVMSEQHQLFIAGMLPAAKNKIRVLNVMDPIGMSMPVYEDVMNVIEKKLKELWAEIIA